MRRRQFGGGIALPRAVAACRDGDCAANWPPVAPPTGKALVAPFSTITRDDGSKQLAFAGRPLYTFIVDQGPGQTSGDGINAFGGLWHIARPH